MNTDDLKLIRNKHNELICKIEQLNKVKKRILELEQEPLMKEYYSLKKIVEDNNEEALKKQTEKEIGKILIYTKDSNKILYDYGNISVKTYESYHKVEDEYSIMRVYRDLETTEYYFKINDEIQLMPSEWRVGYSVANCEYELLRKYFIEQIQYKSQDEIISELYQKNKGLIKGKIK